MSKDKKNFLYHSKGLTFNRYSFKLISKPIT